MTMYFIVLAVSASQWETCNAAFEIIDPGISFGVEVRGEYGVGRDPKQKSLYDSR